jgi:hypothetical protein
MKLGTLNCPICGRRAIGSVDIISATALLTIPDGMGEVEFTGTTDVHWDGQRNVSQVADTWRVTCAEGHEWDTSFTDTQ